MELWTINVMISSYSVSNIISACILKMTAL